MSRSRPSSARTALQRAIGDFSGLGDLPDEREFSDLSIRGAGIAAPSPNASAIGHSPAASTTADDAPRVVEDRGGRVIDRGRGPIPGYEDGVA